MKTGELAKLLGVSDQTLINWMSRPEIKPFMSEAALGEGGNTQRIYTESDVLVLNTVRMLRTVGSQDWNEIQKELEQGRREQEFPQNAIITDTRTIPMPQAKQAADYAVVVYERDSARELAKELKAQLEEAVQRARELEDKYQEKVQQLDDKYQEKVQQLIEQHKQEESEIREKYEKLLREIGRLEGINEMIRPNDRKTDDAK
jgi:DNA-binding transcriptional MerR regulator